MREQDYCDFGGTSQKLSSGGHSTTVKNLRTVLQLTQTIPLEQSESE